MNKNTVKKEMEYIVMLDTIFYIAQLYIPFLL